MYCLIDYKSKAWVGRNPRYALVIWYDDFRLRIEWYWKGNYNHN